MIAKLANYNNRALTKVQNNIINACGMSKSQLAGELKKFNLGF